MAEHANRNPESEFEEREGDMFEAEASGKRAYSKLIVALCLVTVIAYTATCFVYLWNGKPLNDTLTVLFFGCFGLEFASLAFIKRGELKYVEGNPQNKQLPHIEDKEDSDDSETN